MNTSKNILSALLFLVLLFPACRKEAGIGGKKTITGTVHFKNGATGMYEIASGATVNIAYGETTYSSTFDQTLQADVNGVYHFDGLRKGDYFISAEFTDTHGFKYTTAGYSVSIEKKKGSLTVDIDLQ